jgi:hypothetical protein
MMIYPVSGSLNASSWIRIPDPGGKKAPDPRSYCTYCKKMDENKINLFLAPYGLRNKFK